MGKLIEQWLDNFCPRLVRREGGDWLAVSERGAPIRIAVIGLTADEARNRLRDEAEQWGTLLDEPVQERK